jgi:glyoxylase-like metal-dependent hydrolase (beta-lactamase superfamily II)
MNPVLLTAYNPGAMTGPGNNTYLVTGAGGRAVLIDAGVGHERHLRDIGALLAAERCTLERVLVTHGHADHASGAPAIAALHPSALFEKYPWPEEDSRYDVAWRALADGQTVAVGDDELIVLYTPGHSPDHAAFWHEPTRTVFTGDLVARDSSVMIHWSRGGNLSAYMASLELVLALEPRQLLPAHGPRIDDPRAVLVGYLEHRRARERQVIAAVARGDATVQAIAESIYDGLDPALMPAARENVRAHLEKLKTDGVAVTDDSGRWISSESR